MVKGQEQNKFYYFQKDAWEKPESYQTRWKKACVCVRVHLCKSTGDSLMTKKRGEGSLCIRKLWYSDLWNGKCSFPNGSTVTAKHKTNILWMSV